MVLNREWKEEWKECIPQWAFNAKYRFKPEPRVLYTNSIGEVFTEDDLGKTVYWYDFNQKKIESSVLRIDFDRETFGFIRGIATEVAKTEESALQLAVNHFKK